MTQLQAQGGPDEFTRGYRAWMLFILMLMNALNLADRQGLAALAPVLKRDLQLSDTELGVIQGLGFAIFYTLLGLPIARLSERYSRSRIIAASIAVFSCCVGLASQIRGFSTLLLCRIGVGTGDAGFGPPVASLIGDHYPPGKRASAMTVLWLGAPIGALTGAALGGWTAQHADWRLWFIGLAIPGLIVAALGFFTLREPARGGFDVAGRSVGPIPSIGETMRFLLGKRSMRQVLIGASFAAIGLNGMGQFWARWLVATLHIGTAKAGGLLGTMAVVAMASGLALGGFGVDRAVRRDRRWYVWGPALGLALATPLFLIGMLQPTIPRTMGVLLLAHISLFVFYTPTLAIGQNMVDASMRASSSFTVAIVLGLVGIGFGPMIVGMISDAVAHFSFSAGNFGALCRGGQAAAGADAQLAQACTAASTRGIKVAMDSVAALFLWGAVHYYLAARTLRTDFDARYQAKGA